MIEADHPELSIAQQCSILGISRSSYYYGYRRIARELIYLNVSRKQVRRIMKKAGLRAIYPGLQLSKSSKGSKKYSYLLRGMNIWLPNQVGASDITYIKLSGGYVYL